MRLWTGPENRAHLMSWNEMLALTAHGASPSPRPRAGRSDTLQSEDRSPWGWPSALTGLGATPAQIPECTCRGGDPRREAHARAEGQEEAHPGEMHRKRGPQVWSGPS